MDWKSLGISIAAFATCLFATIPDGGASELGFKLVHLSGHLVKWGSPALGTGAVVSYAFIGRHEDFGGINCTGMDPIFAGLAKSKIDDSAVRSQVVAAFALWSSAANISFVEAADPDAAGILIGSESKAQGWAFTNVEDEHAPGADPPTGAQLALGANDTGALHAEALPDRLEIPHAIRQSRICFNTARSWKVGYDGNLAIYDLKLTLAHEIGHAIGLDHPGATGALMGYRYTETVHGLTASDIQGVTTLYGSRPSRWQRDERNRRGR